MRARPINQVLPYSGQSAYDNEQDHPPQAHGLGGRPGGALAADLLAHLEKLQDHALDVLPVIDEDCDQCAEMEQHVKEHARIRQAEEVLEQGQVSGTGNGQKLRQSLNQSEKDRGQKIHTGSSFSYSGYYMIHFSSNTAFMAR